MDTPDNRKAGLDGLTDAKAIPVHPAVEALKHRPAPDFSDMVRDNQTPKRPLFVAICIPHSRHTIFSDVAFALITVSCPPGVGRSISTSDIQPISQARNFMVAEALKNPRVTHILMLEPDVEINPGALHEILSPLAGDPDIISCPVFGPYPPYESNAFTCAAGGIMATHHFTVEDHRYIDLDSTGPGCVMFKRKCFDQTKPLWFEEAADRKSSDVREFTGYFAREGWKVKASSKCFCNIISTQKVGHEYRRQYIKASE